jgi:hypothetical protein
VERPACPRSIEARHNKALSKTKKARSTPQTPIGLTFSFITPIREMAVRRAWERSRSIRQQLRGSTEFLHILSWCSGHP